MAQFTSPQQAGRRETKDERTRYGFQQYHPKNNLQNNPISEK